MSARSAPIASTERILTLDVVRGVALLGIFIMNVPGFNSSFSAGADGTHLWPEWWDRAAATLRDVLFSGKFNSMFSMLFAVGFTIQLERLLSRDPKGGMRIYIRRIGWLLAFGVMHACIFWTGDVLHMYALLGFVLLLIRNWPDRVIVALIVACLLYSPVMGIVRFYTMTPDQLEYALRVAQEWEASDNIAYGQGSFLDAAMQNTKAMVALYSDPVQLRGTIGFYVQITTTMLLGLLLGRHAFFQNAARHLARVGQIQWAALGIGAVTGAIFGIWEATVDNPSEPSAFRVLAGTCYALCRVSLMIFYVATLIRAVHTEKWRARLQLFAPAGRMPLTNYLLQTLIATCVFFSWGLGYWNRVGPALSFAFAVVVYFAIQIPFSRWWLKDHELGPMEYVWRVLTYGRGATQAASLRRASEVASGELR